MPPGVTGKPLNFILAIIMACDDVTCIHEKDHCTDVHKLRQFGICLQKCTSDILATEK
jgi:hypothetical protein